MFASWSLIAWLRMHMAEPAHPEAKAGKFGFEALNGLEILQSWEASTLAFGNLKICCSHDTIL
jgi:hypothetical protein